MVMNKIFAMIRKPGFITIFLCIVVFVMGGLRIMFYVTSPDVLLLTDRAGAHWIKYDSEIDLGAKPSGLTRCEFQHVFKTDEKLDHVVITVQALKKAEIFLDGVHIFSAPDEFDQWKKTHYVNVPFTIEPGPHVMLVSVISENSHPAVMAYSEKLSLKTDHNWLASTDGRNWSAAVPVSQTRQLELSEKFPSSISALKKIFPYLAGTFLIVFMISFCVRSDSAQKRSWIWRLEPSHVRWVLLFLWAVLSLNNMIRLSFQAGSDVWGHVDYIGYIATKGSLPLFPEGWQMFHPPLNYLLSAPLYAVLIQWLDLPSVVKIMAIVPVICGLLQIEIVYRVGSLVFAEKKDLQVIAVIAGSLLPVHTYACQYVGNEPLAAFLISLTILLCLPLVMPDQREQRYGYFILLGIVLGLALLAKMTALLMAPVLIIATAFHAQSVQKPLKYFMRAIIMMVLVSLLIAGWYYLRNYLMLGNPFPGVFDALVVMQWWQDPGYRLWSHLFSFGHAVIWPVFAGITSFWDMFYSTLWLDGLNSGLMDFIPWNENFMIAGALLALIPSLLMLIGIISMWTNKRSSHRHAVMFSTGVIVLFLAAMIDMYMVCPVYSRTKASYTLGLLPCYAILMAAGAEPFLKNKIVRSIALALFACWAVAAYCAYFVVKFQ